LDDKPASYDVKQECLREAQEALEIAKPHTFPNTVFSEHTLGKVKQSLGLPTDHWSLDQSRTPN